MLSDQKPRAEDNTGELWNIASYLINRISHRYNTNLQQVFKAKGLTTLNARAIVSLKIYGPLTVNELCIHAIAEQPTMSRALDRLQSDGLVSRLVDESDSRSRIVRLTPQGERSADDILPVMVDANDDLMADFDPAERAMLMALLKRVLKKIRKNPV